MLRYKTVASVLLVTFIFSLVTPIFEAWALDSVPTITSISPSEGPRTGGGTIVINGSNFSKSGAEVQVYFGDTRAEYVNVKSNSRIEATIPGADTAGEVWVKVVVKIGEQEFTSNFVKFKYISTPKITSDNLEGSTLGGYTVTITGEEFQRGIRVYIGGKEVQEVNYISETEIKVVVPSNSSPGPKDIKIVNPDGGSYTLVGGFNYITSQPTITSITPTEGNSGTKVTIRGEQFSRYARVKFGETFSNEVIYISSNELEAEVPSGSVGTKVNVSVINPDGAQAVSSEEFSYIIMPTISSVTPNYGWIGDRITIKGSNFDELLYDENGNKKYEHAKVEIGGIEAKVISQTNTELVVEIEKAQTQPDGKPLTVELIVSNRDNPNQKAVAKFTFTEKLEPPEIQNIEPNTGSTLGGDTVTITGKNFRVSIDGELPEVYIGGKKAQVKSVTTNEIVIVTPSNSGGYKDVRVINPDGSEGTLKEGFLYKTPESRIAITGITPNRGYYVGGITATITGVNFPEDKDKIEVRVGGNEAEILDASSQAILIKLPPGSIPEGQTEYKVNVIVSVELDVDGKTITEKAELIEGFTYVYPKSQPSIDKIYYDLTKSNVVPLKGDVKVKITGTGFVAGDNFGVYIHRTDSDQYKLKDVTITTVEEEGKYITYIEGVVPDMSHLGAGAYDVYVINNDFAVAIKPNGIIYKGSTMAITSITPNYGSVQGKETVTIKGVNFDEDPYMDDNGNPNPYFKVYFEYEMKEIVDGTERTTTYQIFLTEVEVKDSRTIVAKTPSSTVGWKDLVISNRYGEARLKNAFEYRMPIDNPNIESIDPQNGPVTGGTKITITGEGFVSGAKVYIGDNEASQVDVQSTTTIVAVTPPGEPGLQPVKVVNPDGGSDIFGDDPDEIGFLYYTSPEITSVSPKKASVYGGNIITLTGKQFYNGMKIELIGESDEEGNVYEIDIPAENIYVESQEKALFRIPIPSGTDGKYPTGNYTVQITNVDGGTAQWDFLAIVETKKPEELTIDSIIPSEGPDSGGTEVIITGQGFEYDAQVFFGFKPSPAVTVVSPYEIRAVTPPNEPGVYDVTVVNVDEGSAVVAEGAFTYKKPQTNPKITQVTPNVGPKTGGTKIMIIGENFWPGAQVYIGPYRAIDVKWISNQLLTATTPTPDVLPNNEPMDVGTYDIIVVNPDSSSAILRNAFTVKSPINNPVIDSITPNKVVTTGGNIVTIGGSNFRQGVQVFFGSKQATVLELNEEAGKIIVKAPANSKGKHDVTVINTDGGIGQVIDGIEYILPESEPKILSIEPAQGSAAGGTLVTITGDDFRDGLEVYFGHVKVNDQDILEIKYNSIILKTPAWTGELDKNGTAVVDVTVVNLGDYPGSATKPKAFTYVASNPKIHSVAPNIGSYKGGDFITILGEDFTDKVQVFLGDMEIQVVDIDVVNAGKIIFKTPSIENNLSKYLHVPLDVKVINKDGQTAVLPKAFTYKYPASSPKIIDVIPASGSTVGGQPIEIIGEDFREVIDPKTQQLLWPKVIIGGKEATDVVFISSERIKCRIPANPPGAAEVVVINEDGAMAVWKGFMYIAPLSEPKITAVTPGQGPGAGGTLVTITGSDFRKGEDGSEPLVWFGNNLATDITWVAHNKITAVTPPGQGTVDVIVVNPDKGQAIYKGGFKYIDIPAPKLDSVTPNVGPASGGTPIEIKGDMFAKGAQVYIGGNLASDIEVVDKNTIRAVTPPGDPGWQEVRVVNPDGGWAKLDQGFLYRGKPDRPGWLQARAVDYQTIELTWEEVDFANNYEIYISTGSSGPYTFLDQVDGQDVLNKNNGEIRYYVTKLKPDTRYYFKVRAVNELGASELTGYAWAITDDKAPKNYGKTPAAHQVVVNTTTGAVEVAIPTLEALKNAGYLLDLREQNKGTYRLNFSAEALTASGRYLTVLGNGFTLSFDPWSILHPQHWGKSSRQLEGIYSNLIITDLGQQEAERALRSLPKGAKLLSRVYGLAWENQEDKKKTAQDAFHSSFILSLEYSPAQVPAGKKVDIFTYNAQKGKWEATYAGSTYGSTLTLTLKKPGRFVIVAY